MVLYLLLFFLAENFYIANWILLSLVRPLRFRGLHIWTHLPGAVQQTLNLRTHLPADVQQTLNLRIYLPADVQQTLKLRTHLPADVQQTLNLRTHLPDTVQQTLNLRSHLSDDVQQTQPKNTFASRCPANSQPKEHICQMLSSKFSTYKKTICQMQYAQQCPAYFKDLAIHVDIDHQMCWMSSGNCKCKWLWNLVRPFQLVFLFLVLHPHQKLRLTQFLRMCSMLDSGWVVNRKVACHICTLQ